MHKVAAKSNMVAGILNDLQTYITEGQSSN